MSTLITNTMSGLSTGVKLQQKFNSYKKNFKTLKDFGDS